MSDNRWKIGPAVAVLLTALTGGTGPQMPESQARQLQDQLLELEWKISEKWGAAQRIATAPVIPGRVDVVPSPDPFSDRYRIVRGESLYVKDAPQQVSTLHAEIEQLSKQYVAIEKQLQAGGRSVPRLLKCDRCDGKGISWGPHYELGRREDGSLGMVFNTGGLHACPSCGGSGVCKPSDTVK